MNLRSRLEKVTDTEDVGKTERPIVNVLWRIEQGLDEIFPLVRVMAGEKLSDSLGRRQRAGQVQADTPQEFLIVRELGGNDVEPSELRENMLVNKVGLFDLGVAVQGLRDYSEPGADREAGGTDHNGCLAGVHGADNTVGGDINHFAIVRYVEHLRRDVFPASA